MKDTQRRIDLTRDLRIFVDELSWPVRLTICTPVGTAEIAHVVPRLMQLGQCPYCGRSSEEL